MIDSVLKGTGNSRFLKSAVPAGTSWADALAMLQAGTFPIDFNGINAEGFQQVGTPLNKANLLKDATAAQIGLPPSTTPDGMFQALGNTGELHVWRKTVIVKEPVPEVPGSYTLGSAAITNLARMTSNGYNGYAADILVSKEIKVNLDGSVELVSPTSRQMVVSGSSESYTIDVNSDELLGAGNRYFTPSKDSDLNSSRCTLLIPPGTVYYVAPGTTYATAERSIGFTSAFNAAQLVTGVPGTPAIPAGTTTTYPVSTNPNAYQEGDDAKPAGYTLGDVVTSKVLASKCYNNTAIYYGKSVSVSDDGIVSILNPTTRTLSSTLSSAEIAAIKDGFVYFSGNENYSDVSSAFRYGNIVYIPADASVSTEYANSAYGVYIDRYQPVTGYAAIPAGTTIEYLGKLGDKARVQVVSYVGTGTYGSDHPNSLTFNFVPKMVKITCDGDANFFSAIYGMRQVVTEFSTGYYVTVKWSKNTLSWYSDNDPGQQMNDSGDKYYAIAIG